MLFRPSCGYDGLLPRDLDAVLPVQAGSPAFPLCLENCLPSSLFWKATSSGSLNMSPTHIHWEVSLTLVWSDVPSSNFQRLESKKALKCENPRADPCRAGFPYLFLLYGPLYSVLNILKP